MKKLIAALFVFCSLMALGFSESYHARRGLFLDVDTIHGSFYDGFGLTFTSVGGLGLTFYGFDISAGQIFIQDNYKTDSTCADPDFVSGNFLVGLSLKLGPIKPYITGGIGGCIISDQDNPDYCLVGLLAEGIGGVDLCLFDILSIGACYKIKFMYGAGFTESYSITTGIIF